MPGAKPVQQIIPAEYLFGSRPAAACAACVGWGNGAGQRVPVPCTAALLEPRLLRLVRFLDARLFRVLRPPPRFPPADTGRDGARDVVPVSLAARPDIVSFSAV